MIILVRIMAGKIPQQFIDDLLTRVDIIDVVDGYVPLRKAGRNHQARCPFHEEKTPSFTVSQEKQFYHCFGCGTHGTAISFLMDYAGMDFVEAIEELAARAGLEVPREGANTFSDNKGITELYELMEMVVRYYCRQLREHPDAARAIDYLKSRGIDGQLAAEFELGYAPPGWENLISALGGSSAALLRLAKTGMVITRDNGGYYDRFRERIIFPIRDLRGRAIGMGGRVLDDSTPKYLNSPETPIFHKGHELYGLYQARCNNRELQQLFVVEGYMDVLALAQHGIHNAAATLGTAVTQEHLQQLFKVTPRLVFCFDGDSAGQKAAWRALEISLPLLRDGRQIHYLFMPAGEDPDSFVRQQGREKFTDSGALVTLSDYLLNTLKQQADLNKREDRALLAEKVIAHLAKLPAGALLELLLTDLANLCQLSIDSLRLLLQNKKPELPGKKRAGNQRMKVLDRPNTNLVSKVIRLLLHNPGLALNAHVLEPIRKIDDQGIRFLCELMEFISTHPGTTCAGILEHWRGTRYEQRLNDLAAMENLLAEGELIEDKDIQQEFLDYISKIEQSFKRKQRELQSRNISNLDDLRRLYGKGQNSQKD